MRFTSPVKFNLCLGMALLGTGCQTQMNEEGRILPFSLPEKPELVGSIAFRRRLPESNLSRLEHLQRGKRHYETFCAPCHGIAGYGDGRVVQRGGEAPRSFHEPRLREASDSTLLFVINRGSGRMPAFSGMLRTDEASELVDYLRVLQFSQHALVSQLMPSDRTQLFKIRRQAGGI